MSHLGVNSKLTPTIRQTDRHTESNGRTDRYTNRKKLSYYMQLLIGRRRYHLTVVFKEKKRFYFCYLL